MSAFLGYISRSFFQEGASDRGRLAQATNEMRNYICSNLTLKKTTVWGVTDTRTQPQLNIILRDLFSIHQAMEGKKIFTKLGKPLRSPAIAVCTSFQVAHSSWQRITQR